LLTTRKAAWSFEEVRRRVKTAWRESYRGVAAVIALGWDTSMSPADVRSLTPSRGHRNAFRRARASLGGATKEQNQNGNALASSVVLRTYAPTDLTTALQVGRARRIGRANVN
jgi:hypothetical protein